MNEPTLAELLRASHLDMPTAHGAADGTRPTGCPSLARLLALAGGPLEAAERARLEAHVAGCPACAAELELAAAWSAPVDLADPDVAFVVAQLAGAAQWREAGQQAPVALAAAPSQGSPGTGASQVLPWRPADRRGWASLGPTRLALAAALVAGVGLSLVFALGGGAGPPALPPPPATDVARGARLELLAPRGELAAPPSALRFVALSGEAVNAHAAVVYRVRLLRVDGTLLWEATTVEAEIPLPAEVAAALAPAATYQWQAEALDGQGAVQARSGLARFSLTPPPPAGPTAVEPTPAQSHAPPAR